MGFCRFGPQKSGRNKGVVVLRGGRLAGFHCTPNLTGKFIQ